MEVGDRSDLSCETYHIMELSISSTVHNEQALFCFSHTIKVFSNGTTLDVNAKQLIKKNLFNHFVRNEHRKLAISPFHSPIFEIDYRIYQRT